MINIFLNTITTTLTVFMRTMEKEATLTLGSAVQKSNRRTCAEECGRPFINRITHEHELKFITYS